ncbi:MAG TPA: DUF6166 domain-containing protein [Solirubrobacteraceae bacterium]|nr:DUF6166 domain-containing protein [Solirubrobacteraceae bacterium]
MPGVTPAPARPGSRGALERYYVGRRPHDTEVYVVTGSAVDRLEHPGYRSDADFDWGSATPGALELAFAMLAHATGRRPPEQVCRIFQAEVVAGLDRAGFVLGDGDIALWLLTALDEPGGPCDGSAPGGPPYPRSRLARWLRSRLRRS